MQQKNQNQTKLFVYFWHIWVFRSQELLEFLWIEEMLKSRHLIAETIQESSSIFNNILASGILLFLFQNQKYVNEISWVMNKILDNQTALRFL